MVHTNAKGWQRPRATKRSTGAFAIATRWGLRAWKWSQRWRNPLDSRFRLKAHSKARTPVANIAKAMKRTEGALRRICFARKTSRWHLATSGRFLTVDPIATTLFWLVRECPDPPICDIPG